MNHSTCCQTLCSAVMAGKSWFSNIAPVGSRLGRRMRRSVGFVHRRLQAFNAHHSPRFVWDALESRVLLSSTLLNFSNHTDMIVDSSRNQIDIVSNNGVIHRYDVASGKMLSDIVVTGASLSQGDITTDGKFLYLVDTAATLIHKVDLNSGLSTSIVYTATANAEAAPSDLVIVSDTLALFSNRENGSGNQFALHTINLTTDEIGKYTTGPLAKLYSTVRLDRSVDRDTVLLRPTYSDGSPFNVYDTFTNTIVGNGYAGSFGNWACDIVSMSADGGLIATADRYSNSTTLWDAQGKLVRGNLPGGATCFNPVLKTIYVFPSGTSKILAYDTETFKLKGTFDIGEGYNYGASNSAGTGLMTASSDGKTLFVATNQGVRVLDVNESKFVAVTMAASVASSAPGKLVTLTVTLSGQLTYSGTLVINDGDQVLSSINVTGNKVSYAVPLLSAGVHHLSATFIDAKTQIGSPSDSIPIVGFEGSDSADFLPVASRNQTLFDSSRNQLLVISANGDVLRYDVSTSRFLAPYHIDGALGGGGITHDSAYLYINDTHTKAIHKLDLATGAVTDILDTSVSTNYWTSSITILSDRYAIFKTNLDKNPIRLIDLTTDTITALTSGVLSTMKSGDIFNLSADGQTMLIMHGSSDGYPIQIFDIANNTISASTPISFGSWGSGITAISRDGALAATTDRNTHTTTVWDHLGHAVLGGLPGGAVYFSPVNDTLFILQSGTSHLLAYDTSTFAIKTSFDINENYSYDDFSAGVGLMRASTDGTRLFVTTASGIHVVDVDESKLVHTKLTVSADSFYPGKPVTLTATFSGQLHYTGVVVFKDGDAVLATVPVNGNVATYSVSSLAAGTHDITAVYVDSQTKVGSPSAVAPIAAFTSAALSNLLPLTSHNEIIVNTIRNEFYIVGSNGDILQYSIADHAFIKAIHINGSLGRGDISVDGNSLYLVDTSATVIHKIDLTSGLSVDLGYNATWSGERFGTDLVVLSDTLAVFSSYQAGSGAYYPLHTINLVTGEIGAYSSGPLRNFAAGVQLNRSADRSTLLLVEYSDDGTPFTVFDCATQTVTGKSAISTGWWSNSIVASNADGSLIATTDRQANTTTIWNRAGAKVATTLPGGAVYFNPVLNVLYILENNSTKLRVYDTATFTLKATYDIGQRYSYNDTNVAGTGSMAVSPSGSTLFIATNAGISIVNVGNANPPAPVLTQSVASVDLGDSVTFTATLPASDDFWMGSVVFKSDGKVIGTVPLDQAFTATLTIKQKLAGSRTITATFVDSVNQKTSDSAPVVLQVAQAKPAIDTAVVDGGSISRAPTLSVKLTGVSGINVTGTVALYDGETLVGTGTISYGTAQVTLNSVLAAGDHAIKAVYTGDVNYEGVISQPVVISIARHVSTITISASAQNIADDESSKISVVVASNPGEIPTGTVAFYDGETLLGTVNLNNQGIAELTVGQLPVGAHSIRAVYSGSTDILDSSGTLTLNVIIPEKAATTVKLTVDDSYVSAGQQVVLSVSISAANHEPPHGTIAFYDGARLLGTAQVDQGVATFKTEGLAAGAHAFSAVFKGNQRFGDSSSSVVTVTSYEVTVVDLLVLYTDAATSIWGGLFSQINTAVEQTNEALANSLIPVVIRLVGTESVNYKESGNFTTDITRLATYGDHYLDDAFELRNRYHADLVSLFVSEAEYHDDYATLGIASTLTSAAGNYMTAFSVISAPDAVDNNVLAHELGHNFGARHETVNDKNSTGFTTGRGYQFAGEDGSLYHDIMAYGSEDSTLIPYYSNPNISYEGMPIGTAKANAAAIIAKNALVISQYSEKLGGIKEPTKPTGAMTAITPSSIAGWAYDDNLGSKPAKVQILIDGEVVGTILADAYDPTLDSDLGSSHHGFNFRIPASVATGKHSVELLVLNSPGTSWVSVASGLIDVNSSPDLAVSVGQPVKPLSTYVPGDVISVPVTITNNGLTAAIGSSDAPITVIISLATGTAPGSTKNVVATVKLPYSIAAGASRKINVPIPLTLNLAAGEYYLCADVDSGGVIAEANEENNSFASVSALNYVWQFGNVAGRSGSTALTFNDQDGTRVTLNLSGSGTGTLIDGADGYDIKIAGTTSKSAFSATTVKSKQSGDNGRFTLHNLTVGNYDDKNDQTGISAITAKTTDVTGDIKVAGILLALAANDMVTGSNILVGRLDQGTRWGPELNVTLGRVSDLSIESTVAINTISVIDWQNQLVAADVIHTSYIRQLKVTGSSKLGVAGDFNANLDLFGAPKASLDTLGTVNIAGEINSVAWYVHGAAGSITARSSTAGWNAMFDGSNANVRSIKLTGKSLDSAVHVTADSLGSLIVMGNLVASQLVLSQAVSKTRSALDTLNVAGYLADSEIRADGNIGTITAETLLRTGVYVGARKGLTGLAGVAEDLADPTGTTLPTISRIQLKGAGSALGPIFEDCFVVAPVIKSVVFPSKKSIVGPSENSFGFSTLRAVATYVGPASNGFYISPKDSIV